MRLAFFINTPAQVHLFRNLMTRLKEDGDRVIIVAREYGDTTLLLDSYNLEYFRYSEGHKPKLNKLLGFPADVLRACNRLKSENLDLVLGMGAHSNIVSRLLDVPNVIFNDSEPIPLQLPVLRFTSNLVITPECFNKNLGSRHLRLNTYKELAYLHPNNFTPDSSVLECMDVDEEEDFVLLRFNGFGAVHDVGRSGFSLYHKRLLVQELSKYARVFISSEERLPDELRTHEAKIRKSDIHSVLYYAKTVVADTQTLITEAAVLGTPGIRCNSFVGEKDMGNFIELQERYGLVFNYRDPKEAIQKAVQLVQDSDLKRSSAAKRDLLLKDKIDLTAFLIQLIQGYHDRSVCASETT